MAELPDVTVIIPTRNRSHYLAEAAASALSQQQVNLELLIINDGQEPVADFNDARVQILDNHKRGAVPARNLGAQAARTRFIAFLDDDDWWIDDLHLHRCASAIKGNARFVFADGVLRYESGAPELAFAFDADRETLTRDNTILISAVCYDRSLHETLGFFDESLPYYWDWDWYIRVARSGAALGRIPQPSVMIRVHDGNMSGKDTTADRRKNLDAFTIKHGLAHIELKNHESLARQGSLKR
jgi:glycosyltransferase involved in cell wall biosynthesis